MTQTHGPFILTPVVFSGLGFQQGFFFLSIFEAFHQNSSTLQTLKSHCGNSDHTFQHFKPCTVCTSYSLLFFKFSCHGFSVLANPALQLHWLNFFVFYQDRFKYIYASGFKPVDLHDKVAKVLFLFWQLGVKLCGLAAWLFKCNQFPLSKKFWLTFICIFMHEPNP